MAINRHILILTFLLIPMQSFATPDYANDIRPILAENCYACHGPDANTRESDLRFDDIADAIDYGAITPGDLEDSLMIEHITAEKSRDRMPPADSKKFLTPEQIQLLKEEVGEQDISEVVSRWTGIPVSRLMEGEIEKLLHMEQRLHRRVVGQDEAITAVSNAVRRARAGLQDPKRPIGSFLFLGPTGVGKTELARALAEFMFDDENSMIRIDMSEYQERHTVARLLGAPPGYIGYDEGGQLTEAVRRRPYAVILFDEIEKAHPEVFNTLLQLLDDGRLTDGHGRVVDFKNTVVIMTSNIGSRIIKELAGADADAMQRRVLAELDQHFRPEFLNRIDETIIFHSLTREDLKQIVDIQIEYLQKLLSQRKIDLQLTDAAKQYLAEAGYDPVYGARPLKRVIQREVQDRLAMLILQGRFSDGDTILADRDEPAGLVFTDVYRAAA